MYNMNSIYNPDHQQVLEYHNELLKKGEHERLLQSIMPKPKHPLLSLQKLLQFVTSIRHTHKLLPTTQFTGAQLYRQSKHR